MAVLEIVGDRPRSGKTSLAAALLTLASSRGRKVSYYKPLSASPAGDPDVAFVSQQILASTGKPDVPAPHELPRRGDSSLSPESCRQIKDAVDRLEANCDLLVIDGPDLYASDGQTLPLPRQLAPLIGARVILLFRYTPDLDAARIATAAEPLADRLAGVVINGVTRYRHREVEQLVAALRQLGIPVFGTLPEDRQMLAVTVEQVAKHLGGSWVPDTADHANTDVDVDRFLIGANIMDAGATYFGRYENQVVITPAGRPDMQMASFGGGTRCLVLTGGGEPIDYIKAEAAKRHVPLMLVQSNTVDTADALGGLLHRADVYNSRKVQRLSEIVQQNFDKVLLDAAIR